MDDGIEFFLAKFGTTTPLWRLTYDSDALHLSGHDDVTAMAVPLAPEEAAMLRTLTAVKAQRTLHIAAMGHAVRLQVVGRKTDLRTWSGTAATY